MVTRPLGGRTRAHAPRDHERAAQQHRTQARAVRYNGAATIQGTRGELTGNLSVPSSLMDSERC